MFRTPLLAAAALLGLSAVSTAQAGGTAIWSTTNVEYLYGTNYNPIFGSSDTRSVVTIEHADGWKYGDNFFFVDITNADRQDDTDTEASYYGELSPRLSFGKMLGKDLSYGIIQDVLITTTLEMPQSPVEQTYLYGLAVDLKLPKFAFFQTNFYVRDNQAAGIDTGYQVTLAWLLPFNVGKAGFAFEGFFDYAFGEDPLEDNIITAPRLLLDVGSLFGKPGCVQAGVEYQIWRNQYGIKDEDEDVAQAMVKWILN
jgi:nucleoside-specific outer membrane channel protein Tsx